MHVQDLLQNVTNAKCSYRDEHYAKMLAKHGTTAKPT